MGFRTKKGIHRLFTLDFYYSVLRRDWRISTLPIDIILKTLAILVVSINRFINDACHISASALTFYSMLSIIPIISLLLAIARGFGVAKIIENTIRNQYFADPQITNFLIEFANNTLAHTRGGLITGIGIVLLLWSVIKVLSSTELTINRIWRIDGGRSLARKVTEYMSIMFIAPILMILISTLNVFLTSNLDMLQPSQGFLNLAGIALVKLLAFVPYLLVWLLFIFIYMFMPTVAVRFKHAFWAGVIAGTVFQVVQWFYIRFQIGVSSYNAVYGSLAALPLLLIWIQLSWSIVLWGAELCYIFRNRHFMFKNESMPDLSWTNNVTIAIRVIEYIAQEFSANHSTPSLSDLSKKLRVNTGKLRIVIQQLINKNILVEVKEDYDVLYYPAKDFHKLSISDIIIKLSELDISSNEMWKLRTKEAIRNEFRQDSFLKE